MAKTDNLRKARVVKNDEFYTQLHEIENELKYYSPYLRGKIVYCNCDSPRYSNFWKYFYNNFHILGLRGLVSTYLDKVVDETIPSYVYYKGSECIDKQCEQNLMQVLGDKFNSNETPAQNLIRNGYLQVYDCGSIEVIYRKETINDNKEK